MDSNFARDFLPADLPRTLQVVYFSGIQNILISKVTYKGHPPMAAFYKIDRENRLVMTTAYGTVTLADALAHQEKIRRDPDFDPSFSQLLDVTHVTKLEITSENVRLLAQSSSFSQTSRRALLVSNDAAYGLARMFEILRESAGDTGIEVFRSLDEALEWVLTRRASA